LYFYVKTINENRKQTETEWMQANKKNGKLQAKRKKLHLMHTESGEGQGFSGNSNIGVGIGSTSIK